jgi:hypothetical protein
VEQARTVEDHATHQDRPRPAARVLTRPERFDALQARRWPRFGQFSDLPVLTAASLHTSESDCCCIVVVVCTEKGLARPSKGEHRDRCL